MFTNNFKQYTYVKFLGKGVQAVVNQHKDQNQIIAVKNYLPTADGDIDFGAIKEVNFLQKLVRCSHVNQLIDVDFIVTQDSLFIRLATNYYTSDLDYFIRTQSIDVKLNYFSSITNQLLEALYVLHYRGIIHCDIKPPNIMIDDQNRVYLADFGLAVQLPCDEKYRDILLTRQGSPLYLAPEILTYNDYYNDKIDLWSLGITLLEYLTNNIVTDPPMIFLNNNEDNVSIIYQILTLSHLQPDKMNYGLIKHKQLHGMIDVHAILHQYQIILSQQNTQLLTSLLQINPLDRLNITSYQFNVCQYQYDILPRGDLHAENFLSQYYDALYQLIEICDNLILKVSTCLLAIDLFERYVVHFKLTDLKLASATCLLLMTKLNESINLDCDDIVTSYHNIFTKEKLQLTQIIIFKRFNFVLTSCETDELLHFFNDLTLSQLQSFHVSKQLVNVKMTQSIKINLIEHQIIYPLLLKTFKELHLNGIFSGSLFAFEMIEYVENNI